MAFRKAAFAAIALALPSLSSLAALAAEPDVLILANGDRLSGRVLKAEGDVVRLESTYGPVIEIPRSAVVRLIRGGQEFERPPVPAPVPASRPPAPAEPAEPVAVDATDIEVDGRLTLGATAVADGQRTIQADGELTLDWGDRSFRVSGTFEEAVNGDERSVDRQRLDLRYANDISERWYSAAQGNFTRDGFRDLRRRITASGAIGRYLIDRTGRQLSVEAGPALVAETFADDDTEWSPSVRLAYAFSQDLFDARTTAIIEQEALVAADSLRELLFRSRFALSHKLTEELEARAEMRHEYDTDVPPGRDPNDLTYILGIGVTF